MIFRPALCVTCSIALALAGCTPGFQSNVTPIKNPSSYKASYQSDGFQIGFDVLSTQEQIAQFGVDMTKADVVPIRVVARNDGNDELYVQEDQIFGKTDGGDLYPAYRLDQSIDRIRNSEVGKAMASGAAMGLIIGAAIGAAAGAAISSGAGGNAGQGAAVGAAVGGTGGGLSGAAAAGDSTSQKIKNELRKVDWGDRVVYPGHIEYGYVFMKPGVGYQALEVLLYDVNKRQNNRISIPLN